MVTEQMKHMSVGADKCWEKVTFTDCVLNQPENNKEKAAFIEEKTILPGEPISFVAVHVNLKCGYISGEARVGICGD